MALKRMLSDEMIHVSSAWIDPKSGARKAILANPILAPILPCIQKAHDTLAVATQPSVADPRLSEIIEEESRDDSRHDEIIRGTDSFLSGACMLLGPDKAATDLSTLRDFLMPDGLESLRKTYRAEAGQASQLADRLSPEVRAQLASISVGRKSDKKTLAQFVDEWIRLGAALGKLEAEKAQLLAPRSQSDPGQGSQVVKARNQWIRTANALIASASIANIDEEADSLIFGTLRATEKVADRRGRSHNVDKGPSDASDPDPSNQPG